VLLATQQRLWENGGEILLTGMTPHVKMVFELAGFDSVFKIS
jgi:anti-anti-sigma regulatory factor